MIIGHQKIQEFFNKAIKNNKLAHAYCFSGIEGLGKKTFALELAADLLKISSEKLDINSDFVILNRLKDGKTEKLKKEISISQIRELKSFLQNFSWGKEGKKIVVIDEAEKLSLGAANSLLKLLEEPGKDVHFFLITTNVELLLETIQSRCQKLYFSLVNESDLINGLKEMGFDKEQIIQATEFACGIPGQAINFLQNEEFNNEVLLRQKDFNQLFNNKIEQVFKQIDNLLKENKDKEINRDINVWIKELRKNLISSIKEGNVLNVNKNYIFLNSVLKAKEHLSQNVNQKLILENLFLNIN